MYIYPNWPYFSFRFGCARSRFLQPLALHRTRHNTEATRTLLHLSLTSVLSALLQRNGRRVTPVITVPHEDHRFSHSLRNWVRFLALPPASSSSLPLLLQSSVKMAEPEKCNEPVRDKNELQIMKVPILTLIST